MDTSPTSPYHGSVYVTFVQFNGQSHSPVYVALSRDGGKAFSTPVGVTAGNVRNNQDARLTSSPDGTLFLTWDNGVQGGKGTVLYVSVSKNSGATWSTPYLFAALTNPVCTFPTSCFNISGGAFRSGGTYPVPAFDAVRNRLVVIWSDIVGTYAQVYLSYASPSDLTKWTAPAAIAPAAGDRFQADPSKWGVPSGSSFRPFIGDYNGIASLSTTAVLTWTGVGATGAPYNLDIDFAVVTP